MQNLSISCALVCLIVLGSAALVGAFGIFHHQISAVLVTGVMYLLAGLSHEYNYIIIQYLKWHLLILQYVSLEPWKIHRFQNRTLGLKIKNIECRTIGWNVLYLKICLTLYVFDLVTQFKVCIQRNNII